MEKIKVKTNIDILHSFQWSYMQKKLLSMHESLNEIRETQEDFNRVQLKYIKRGLITEHDKRRYIEPVEIKLAELKTEFNNKLTDKKLLIK